MRSAIQPAAAALRRAPGLVPEVTAREFSSATLAAALEWRGCLLVRGLVPRVRARALVDDVDRTFDAYDAWHEGTGSGRDAASPWFRPFVPPADADGYALGRAFTRRSGGIYTVDSPRMLRSVSDLCDEVRIGAVLTELMGARPLLSAKKCNVRRTPPHIPGGWHQDGSFVGTETQTVDAWIALSDCGRDSAGLDIVPRRFDALLPTDAGGVVIPHEIVDAELAANGGAIASPEFAAGDALFFDQFFLHRTAVSPAMTRDRYALETWFFAPSTYPESQIPVVY